MTVSNGNVSFGDFRGRVGPDGAARLVGGRDWITGQFAGGRFTGSLYQPFPGCRYALELSRTGT
jgi:hypothetical protein